MEKKLIIVDENDKILDYKEKKELKPKDIYRVSALWIINSRSDILLSKSALTKSIDSDKWGPAIAQTLGKGETYYSNIIKESKEKLGLTNIYPTRLEKERVTGKINFFCQWHFLMINKELKEFVINKQEIKEVKWFTKKSICDDIKKNPKKYLDSVKRIMKL